MRKESNKKNAIDFVLTVCVGTNQFCIASGQSTKKKESKCSGERKKAKKLFVWKCFVFWADNLWFYRYTPALIRALVVNGAVFLTFEYCKGLIANRG